VSFLGRAPRGRETEHGEELATPVFGRGLLEKRVARFQLFMSNVTRELALYFRVQVTRFHQTKGKPMDETCWRRLLGQPISESRLGSNKTVVMAVLVLLVTLATYAVGQENILYSFCALPGCGDGSYPEAGVILDKAGNLYGTTNAGGSGAGTVFTLTASSGKLSTIYTFMGGDDGLGPNSLAFDNLGNLYRTSEYGGGAGDCSNGGCGTIFELVLVNGTWAKNVLYRFGGGKDGSIPQAGVILDPVPRHS
jgi:hypothetical protein